MNISAGPGPINVPGDQWDRVVAFYTAQLGPPASNDGAVAIWQQGTSELRLIRNNGEALTGEPNAFVGWPAPPFQGRSLNVYPVYPGARGSSPYAITLASIKVRSALFPQVELEFGVIHNPPY